MNELEDKKKHLSGSWCNYKDCVYNQNYCCSCNPELVFSGQFNLKGNPIMVCVACCKK